MGVGISTVVPNADAAGPIVSLVFFILVALSGLYFPIKAGSGLATFTGFFPIRHLILGAGRHVQRHPGYVGRGTTSWSLPSGAWQESFVSLRRWDWSPEAGG